MNIIENKEIKDLTTFRIGGKVSFYVEIKNIDELKKAINFSFEKNIPYKILGGGSNILGKDSGFDGLVIKNNIKGIKFDDQGQNVLVVSGAGENWDKLVEKTVDKNLYGLENLSLIPGNVGASPIQNIGAYGSEVKRVIKWVEVFDTKSKEVYKIEKKDCKFGYRDSIFKKPEGENLAVIRVAFDLKKQGITFIGYRDLADYFVRLGIAKATPKEVRKAVIEIRTAKLPDVTKVGTAGSFFKNPVVTKEVYNKLKKQYPEIPGHAEEGAMKLSAGWMIDKLCNMKGVCAGDACVHDRQALVLVNKGNATEKDINKLAKQITDCVKEKTGIELEREVRTL